MFKIDSLYGLIPTTKPEPITEKVSKNAIMGMVDDPNWRLGAEYEFYTGDEDSGGQGSDNLYNADTNPFLVFRAGETIEDSWFKGASFRGTVSGYDTSDAYGFWEGGVALDARDDDLDPADIINGFDQLASTRIYQIWVSHSAIYEEKILNLIKDQLQVWLPFEENYLDNQYWSNSKNNITSWDSFFEAHPMMLDHPTAVAQYLNLGDKEGVLFTTVIAWCENRVAPFTGKIVFDIYMDEDTGEKYIPLVNVRDLDIDVGDMISEGEPEGGSVLDQYNLPGNLPNFLGWTTETDSSLSDGEGGIEVISPPLPLEEFFSSMETMFESIDDMDGYTTDKCGFHIGISYIGKDLKRDLDPVKLILFLEEGKVYKDFSSRKGNIYAKSSIARLRNGLNSKLNGELSLKDLPTLSKALWMVAGFKVKYYGTNFIKVDVGKEGYIEFRFLGGAGYHHKFKEIKESVYRFMYALWVATNPEVEVRGYYTKLVRVLGSLGILDKGTSDMKKDSGRSRFEWRLPSKSELSYMDIKNSFQYWTHEKFTGSNNSGELPSDGELRFIPVRYLTENQAKKLDPQTAYTFTLNGKNVQYILSYSEGMDKALVTKHLNALNQK